MNRWAVLFGALAAVLAAQAALVTMTAAQIAAGWCALAALWIAVAYALGRPRWFGKRDDGRLAAWALLVLAPYVGLNHLVLRLARRPRPLDEIAPGLFLGPLPFASDREAFAAAGIRAVLDLTAEFGETDFARTLPAYRVVPLLDATAPSAAQFEDAVAWCTARLAEGPVYVHCAAGRGRSAIVVAAVLIALGHADSADAADARVRERRPSVHPNAEQRAALHAWVSRRRATRSD